MNNGTDARSNDDTRNTPAAPAHRTHHHRDHPPRLTAGDYRPLRQYTPRANRTNTRPREFTVTRPARFDSDTPEPDTFNHWPRPVGTRRLNCSPIPAVSTDRHRRQEPMARAARTCSTCHRITRTPGRCEQCAREADKARGTSTERGYGTAAHQRFRRAVLAINPICVVCHKAWATVADHHPTSRRDLEAAGEDPNDPHRGRGLCKPCHDRATAANQPGGWHSHTA